MSEAMSEPQVFTEAECLRMIKDAIGRQTGAGPAGIVDDQPLSAIAGIDSVKALRAITDIEDTCHVVIPDDYMFESATVVGLAGFVAKLGAAGDTA